MAAAQVYVPLPTPGPLRDDTQGPFRGKLLRVGGAGG